MKRFMNEEAGVLTFEWILLITILVIGVIAGLAAVRDALNVELADVAQAIGSIDQSYSYYGLVFTVTAAENVKFTSANGSHYVCGSFFDDGITTVTISTKAAHGISGTTVSSASAKHAASGN